MARKSWIVLVLVLLAGGSTGFVAVSRVLEPTQQHFTIENEAVHAIFSRPGTLVAGWSKPNEVCSWSTKPMAEVQIPTRIAWSGPTIISLEYKAFLHDERHPRRNFQVDVEHGTAANFSFSQTKKGWHTLRIETNFAPGTPLRRSLKLRFTFKNPVRPVDLGIGNSEDEQGICLRRIRVDGVANKKTDN
jgi:hypothetical protein